MAIGQPYELITLGVAADILGISQSEMRHRIDEDDLYPYERDPRDPRGIRWFNENQIRAMAHLPPVDRSKERRDIVAPRKNKRFVEVPGYSTPEKPVEPTVAKEVASVQKNVGLSSETVSLPRKTPEAAKFSGEVAAACFKLLEDGKRPVDVVIITGVHPDLMVPIAAAWARLKGAMLIVPEEMKKIEALPWRGEVDLTCAEGLVYTLQKNIERPKCIRCQKHPARICGGCVSNGALAGSKDVGNKDEGVSNTLRAEGPHAAA